MLKKQFGIVVFLFFFLIAGSWAATESPSAELGANVPGDAYTFIELHGKAPSCLVESSEHDVRGARLGALSSPGLGTFLTARDLWSKIVVDAGVCGPGLCMSDADCSCGMRCNLWNTCGID